LTPQTTRAPLLEARASPAAHCCHQCPCSVSQAGRCSSTAHTGGPRRSRAGLAPCHAGWCRWRRRRRRADTRTASGEKGARPVCRWL